MDILHHSIQAAIGLVSARKRRVDGAHIRRDALAMPYLATAHRGQDPDAPAAAIQEAYELARLGVPVAWISARCGLPEAFVVLITAEVADAPGTTYPPRRPGVDY